MTAKKAHAAGTFCWPELCSGNAEESKKFYGALFGWAAEEQVMPEGSYTMFALEGQPLGAMYEMKPERAAAGIRPHWNLYVATDDAEATAKKTEELGGKILTPPFDAGGDRMANLQDPTGAKFCVWQALKTVEAARLNTIGALSWCELYTREPDKAAAFYSGVLGWEAKPWEHGDKPYTMFHKAGIEIPVGGMIEITAEMGPMPAQWLPYFQVEDVDATTAKIDGLGGKVWCQPMEVPTVGRIAFMSDSQGAGFAVIHLNA